MSKFYVYVIMVLLIVSPLMARAGYEEGYMAAQKGAYAKAFKEFNAAALKGDARAQYSLAVMYNDGIGVKKNTAEARIWFNKAAAQGNPLAIEILKVIK